ncbi:hypothetical protein [Sagittula sp. SSi028]|uniref:hypothetical protein n=1 Tax=Sagittula sp. SSi028 TaxID=3400636 RepID=UPI003AF45273
MKNCILHIGTEKTGSTSLQAWLYKNRIALERGGIYLLDTLETPNNRMLPAYYSQMLDEWSERKGIKTAREKNEYFLGFKENIEREVSEKLPSNCTVIISSEHFHSRVTRKSELEKIKNDLDSIFDSITVVCYFRRQPEMALSLYSTSLKFGHTQSVSEFMSSVTPNNYYYNFKSIGDNWSSIFGIENCKFRIFRRDMLIGGDVRRDFMDAANFDAKKLNLKFPEEKNNESLTKVQMRLFKMVNAAFPRTPDRSTIKKYTSSTINWAIKKLILMATFKSRRKVVPKEMDDIATLFAESNAKFLAAYFKDTHHL